MTVAPSSSAADRVALASTIRACLDRHPGPRQFLGDEHPPRIDRELWRTLIEQIGLGGLVIPESCGGFGGGYVDLAVGFDALGATLAPVPALACLGMATGVLLGAEPEAAAGAVLGRIAQGSLVAVLWPPVHAHGGGLLAPSVDAEPAGGGVRLTGSTAFVVDGTVADELLVPANLGDGVVLAALDVRASGVLRRDMTSFDLTRGMAEIALDRAPATIVIGPDGGADALAIGLDLTLTVLAAEQVGLAQECLDTAVAWAKERVQFDRQIGSFQAVKHRLVDLLLQVELARSAGDEAIAAADRHLAERTPGSARELRAAASMAAAMCGEAGVLLARESLHIFGGIGFTWEHDAHLYYRRALANQLVLGDPATHRVRLAATLGV